MAIDPAIVHAFGSTKWEWRKVKIRGPRPTQGAQRATKEPSDRRGRRDERKPLCVEISYLGGPEAVWLLKARGGTWRIPGHRALNDALLDVNGPFWAPRKP